MSRAITERLSYANEASDLREEVRALRTRTILLEALLRKHGIPVPEEAPS